MPSSEAHAKQWGFRHGTEVCSLSATKAPESLRLAGSRQAGWVPVFQRLPGWREESSASGYSMGLQMLVGRRRTLGS